MTRHLTLPEGTALAKLQGRIFYQDDDHKFEYYVQQASIMLGRSDPQTIDTLPLAPAQEGVDVGLGDSNKLSRTHAKIEYDRSRKAFMLHCIGKNGLTVTTPDLAETVIMSPETKPVQLASRSLVQLGDCIFVFLLPAEYPVPPKKRREWIKAEHAALRTLMMRLGYGRWNEIIASTNGRLSERTPEELVPVARKFVARCYIHARPGVEQKVLGEILQEALTGLSEEEVKADIDALIEEAKVAAEPNEKRKYVRWARKLRLLRRLRDIHNHSSLDRLAAGELRVFTPPPAQYWTCQDDVDLILGTYKHGYGATENIRTDPQFGFWKRFSKPLPVGKKGPGVGKSPKSENVEYEDDPDAEEEEFGDEDEEYPEGDAGGDAHERGSSKKSHLKKEATPVVSNSNAHDQPMKTEREISEDNTQNIKSELNTLKLEPDSQQSPSIDAKSKSDNEHGDKDAVMEDLNGSAANSPHRSKGNHIQASGAPTPDQEVMDPVDRSYLSPMDDGEDLQGDETPKRVSERRKPQEIATPTAEGTNSDEAAKAAAKAAAGEDGLVPFPNSEALMRRLKSIINSCAKEFERDQREMKRISQAQSRAQRRKDDLAQRKAEKAAERNRQREERRIAKSQPFSKKDAVEFERALCNFGLDYKHDGVTCDWEWFVSKAPSFRSKYPETLDGAFMDFKAEAHRVVELRNAEEDEDMERLEEMRMQPASELFTQLTYERADRVLERLRFFRLLRNNVLPHRALSAILRGYKKTRELPMWWRSTHDRSLLWGVDRHGLNAWDALAEDPELSFVNSIKAFQRKHADDPKMLKRGAFPKPSAAIKRANALVVYFRSKSADPHYDQIAKQQNKDVGAIDGTKSSGLPPANGRQKDAPFSKRANGTIPGSSLERQRGLTGLRRPGNSLSPSEANGQGYKDQGWVDEESSWVKPKPESRAARPTILDIADSNGEVQLPSDLGDGLYLLSLGNIFSRPNAFHTERVLYPVGYKAVRRMGSRAFLCEIGTDDETAPVFRVSLLDSFEFANGAVTWDDQKIVSEGKSVVNVWLHAMNMDDNEAHTGVELASGPERFGLYEPTVVHYLQELEGAKDCSSYLFRDFSVEGAGAVIMPPVGILSAMTDALGRAKKRQASEMDGSEGNTLPRQDMGIPDAWAAAFGGKRKRRKSSSYWG